jgi:hypothetical protein
MIAEKTDFCAIVNRLRVHYGLKQLSDISGMNFTRLSRISNGSDSKVEYDIGIRLFNEDLRISKLARRRK